MKDEKEFLMYLKMTYSPDGLMKRSIKQSETISESPFN